MNNSKLVGIVALLIGVFVLFMGVTDVQGTLNYTSLLEIFAGLSFLLIAYLKLFHNKLKK